MAKIPVGIQLYTVREESAKDFIGTLQRVAAIGYKGFEFAGYGNLPAAEIKAVLDDLGVQGFSAHIGIEVLEADLEQRLDYQVETGCQYVVVPYMPENRRQSADDWKQVADTLNRIGAACKERGMQLCYHNHAFEFERFGDATGLEILYNNSDPALVQAELDLYWVKKAGEDPVAYVKKFAGRLPLLHIKDMAGDAEGSFAEFGEGILDWDAILAAAPAAGVQWYIVEQDVCKRPCLESIAISYRNLQARGLV